MNPTILQGLLAALRDDEAVVLAMHMASGRQAVLRPLVSDGKDGAEAGNPTADGDPFAWPVGDAARALLEDRSFTVETSGGEVFLRPYNPPVRVVVVGAVHVSQPLARLTSTVGYEVTVVDPRRAFSTEERFPGVHLVRKWPEEALAELAPGHRTAVVTLTHDPKLDDPALAAALATPAFYVGALGSRRTHAARLKRLRERGLDEDALSRIHAPVGLEIGARGPEEIAVAVLGQIVERLRAPRT